MSKTLQSIGSNMYAFVYQTPEGWEDSDFGFEHELGKGIWVYKNEEKPMLSLDEIKQLRDKLNEIIDQEEYYLQIKST